jgi:cell division septation protein DedD
MWYTVLFVVSVAGGNLNSLSVSPGQMPYEDCKEFVDTRNGILATGFHTIPGYRSAYTCMHLPELEALIAKYDCAAGAVDPQDNDILYECKSSSRAPKIPVTTAPVPAASKPLKSYSIAPSVGTPVPASSRPPVNDPLTASSVSGPEATSWAVQVGSFSSGAVAEGVKNTLVKAGRPAFVMPVTSGNMTLYRVRIGPFPNRESAEVAISSVRELAPLAAIVRHP